MYRMEECTCLRELLSESGAIGLLLYKLLIVPGKVLQRFVPFSVVPDSDFNYLFPGFVRWRAARCRPVQRRLSLYVDQAYGGAVFEQEFHIFMVTLRGGPVERGAFIEVLNRKKATKRGIWGEGKTFFDSDLHGK